MVTEDTNDTNDPSGGAGEGASFETERDRTSQPPREDLIDPEDIEVHPEDAGAPDERDEQGLLPDAEDRPESQGFDSIDVDRLTEDHREREVGGPTPPGSSGTPND